MSSSTAKNRISTPNIIWLSSFAIGAIVCAVTSNVTGALLLGSIAVLAFIAVLTNMRPGTPDIGRINALQYRDERDRELARKGFEIVGATALVISVIEVVAATVINEQWVIAATCAQLFVLAVVWAIANSVVVRRG